MSNPKTPEPARRAEAVNEAPRHKRAARRKTAAAPTSASPNPGSEKFPAAKTPGGKLGIVVALMRRSEGATVAQMTEATGWQPHSVRGALAGSLKRRHGLTIVGEAGEGGRVYRIAPEQPA